MHDRLRHFLLVLEAGTFTEAARRAHISQPALSASIKKLEEDIGARLLWRDRRGAEATAAGLALAPRARAALAAVEDGRRAVEEVVGLHAGSVRLGAGPTACTYLLPPTLAAFRREHPSVKYFLREAHNPSIWRGLLAGDLDLGLVPEASEPPDGGGPYESEHCLDDELIVVSGPDPDPDPDAEAAWVTFPRGSTTRELLERHFEGADVVMELGSIAAIKGNVRAGIGRCLISRAAVVRDLKEGILTEVPDPRTPLARSFVLVHRGVDRLPPAAARLREMLLDPRSGPNGGV